MRAAPGWGDGCRVQVWRLPSALPVTLPIVRQLGVRSIIDRFGRRRERSDSPLSPGQIGEFLVLHLLQSEHRVPLYQLPEWAARHAAVTRLYDCAPEAFNDDRVGRVLEALGPVAHEIHSAIATQALGRFHLDARAIHWDLTHVTFSGAHEDWDVVQPGYGGGALHELQMKLSLHVTSDGGVPVRHQALPGGANQAPFAPAMIRQLQAQLGRSDLILVSDSAGISYDNLVTYRAARAHFLAPLQMTAAERAALHAAPFSAFTELAYRSPSAPDDRYYALDTTIEITRQKQDAPITVRALFIYSSRKARQDAADRQKRLDACRRRLEQIAGYLARPRPGRYVRRDFARGQIEQALTGDLRSIVRYELARAERPFGFRHWIDEAALAEAERADGRYLLVLDLPEFTPDQAFALYKRQPLIEQRFRAFKSDLQVHPLWLQKPERILGLLLIFVLALLVYALLERCSVRAGLTSPYYPQLTARRLIQAFPALDFIELHIRGQPPRYQLPLSQEQRDTLNRLGFPDPLTYLVPA